MQLELSEVQGNVVRAYGTGYPCARYLRVRFGRLGAARAAGVLDQWRRDVTFGDPRDRQRTRVNLGFTYAGLEALGVPPAVLSEFPKDFREGARARAWPLRDSWQNTPDFVDGHAIAIVHGVTARDCAARVDQLARTGWWCGRLTRVEDRKAARLPLGVEHFGFADGRSQPAVEGVDLDPVGDGVHTGVHPRKGLRRRAALMAEEMGLTPIERRWRLLRAGEVLLGYENEDGQLPVGPPAPLGANGTFMVYRPIQQDVAWFEDYTACEASRLEIPVEALREKIVGRRVDGSPLAKRRDAAPRPGRDGLPNRRRANDFTYADDRDGFGCPLGAHVRRSNPRDALPGGAERTMRHRIVRRSVPYGAPHGHGEKGLVFVCFSSSIENGFEFIQRNWLNGGEAFGLASDPDFLLQQPCPQGDRPGPWQLRGRMVIQGYRPLVLQPPRKPFVTVRGCEYLFLPSRSGCRWLTQREWLK
jgi:Dyp-type peroxidase family